MNVLRRAALLIVGMLVVACVAAQTPPTAQTATFDSERAFEHLKQLVAIGPRPAGSAGAQKTRDYIRQQMQSLGVATTEQAFDAKTPIGTVKMVNVAATIPGPAPGPGQPRLIIAGHYDTKLFKELDRKSVV